MRYFFMLSIRYIAKNRARSVYSILGIMIAYILCFATFTVGYSIWDYGLLSEYYVTGSYHPAQLVCYLFESDDLEGGSEENRVEDEKDDGVTSAQIEAVKKIEKADEVENLVIEDDGGVYRIGFVTTDQLREGVDYTVYINLKDTSDLRRSADRLSEISRLNVEVMQGVETYLNQGNSDEIYFFRAVIALIAAFISCFSATFLRNTLVISVMERMRDYGLFRCVGMSKKQLFKLLLFEGILLGIGAAVMGTGVGYAFLKIMEPIVNESLPLEVPFTFHFYPVAVIYCILFMIAVILFSLLEPARQATYLTPIDAINRNIVLVRKNGALKEKYGRTKAGIYGKIFGVEGEYAKKNMRRNRGRRAVSFGAVICSVIMLITVQTAFDSLKASYEKCLEGRRQYYQEKIIMNGDCESEEVEKICEEVRSFEDVTGVGTVLSQPLGLSKGDKRFEKQTGGVNLCYAYNESDMEQLKKYLIEGEIHYSDMVKGNQVLLVDMKYHVKDFDTDFKETDVRSTDYHAGDTITFQMDSIGSEVTYTVAGILSDDIFNGATRGETVELIFPQETAIREQRKRSEAELDTQSVGLQYICWEWSIGIARNNKLPDKEIKTYCRERGLYYQDDLFEDDEWGNILDGMEEVRAVSFIVKIIGFFIGFIALIQLINTIYANIVVRKKEFWLYTVVGMGKRQLKKMIMIEHTVDIALAIIIGYLLAWGLSWYLIEYLLNQDGTVIFAWSWARLFPLCVGACGIVFGVVLFAVRGKK